MVNIKKPLAVLIGASMLALTACSGNSGTGNEASNNAGKKESDSKNPVKITFAETIPNDTRTVVLKELIADFEKKNPDIKVNFQSYPVEQSREKLISMAIAKGLPDVFEVSSEWVGTLAVNSGLEDLQPYVDKFANIADISESAINLGKNYQGKFYWIPYGTYGTALYYNKKMFEEAGLQPPATTDDFLNAARALTKPGQNQFGYSFRGGVYGYGHSLLWVMGNSGINSLFGEDGKSLLATPEAITSLEQYATLWNEKLVPPDSLNWSYKETVEAFTSGITGMLIQSNEVVAISQEKMGDNFGTVTLPVGASGKQFDASGQTGYAIASNSKHKEAAARLLEYLMSPEPNLKFTQLGGYTPVLKSIQDDPSFSDGPIKVYKDQMNSPNHAFANLPTFLPEWSEFIGPFSAAEVQKMLLKKQTAEQTAHNLAKFLDDAMAKWNSNK